MKAKQGCWDYCGHAFCLQRVAVHIEYLQHVTCMMVAMDEVHLSTTLQSLLCLVMWNKKKSY